VLTQEHFDKKMEEIQKSLQLLGLSMNQIKPLGNNTASCSTEMNKEPSTLSKTLTEKDLTKLTNDDKKGMLNNAKDIDDINRIFPEFEKWNYEDGTLAGLRCVPCTQMSQSRNPGSSSSSKQLGYLTLNESGKRDAADVIKQQFSNLKKKVSGHVSSESHQKNTDQHQEIISETLAHAVRNEEVGVRIARCALKSIIEDRSQSQFETEVAFLAACGVDVGEINHSREFASKMVQHFADSLRDQLVSNLSEPHPASDRPPPFCIVADAMTPGRVTLQTTGIIANIDGIMKDMFLKASPIANHTGFEFAKVMHEDVSSQLRLSDEQLKSRYVF